MRTDRMLKLAAALEADANNEHGIKFSLSQWGTVPTALVPLNAEGDRDYDLLWGKTEKDIAIPLDCGTTGCAFGFAAISGIFKDEGLGYTISGADILPTFGNVFSFDAAGNFFELPNWVDDPNKLVNKLFDPLYFSITKGREAELEVAKRLRRVAAGDLLADIPPTD